MSSTETAFADDPEKLNSQIKTAMARPRDESSERSLYNMLREWGLPETFIDGGKRGIPVTRFARALWESHDQAGPGDETEAERLYGVRHPFLAGALAGFSEEVADAERVRNYTYNRGSAPDRKRALVENSIVQAASPVVVDPEIYNVLRSQAPVLDVIPTVAQAGFTAAYNTFSGRTLSEFFQTETEAADLSDSTASSFTLDHETRDMAIMATLIDVGDFSQRAEESLDYMDLMDTTMGQVMQEWFITKAGAYLYGDTEGSGETFEDTNGFDGLAEIANDAGNDVDKTSVTSGRLEDLLDYITNETQNSGLTFGNARAGVSPAFYNAIYDEVTPVVRLGGYDADVEFGPRGLAIGHERGTVPITPLDNIRAYSSANGVGTNATDGDVFIWDERAVQFRALAPDSTVPLGRIGLADRAALFSYGTIIDKSLDDDNNVSHTHRLRYGDV